MEKTKFSYSRLDCFHECGFKYKLKYVDKNYPPFTGGIATEFGSLIHATEEAIANSIKNNEIIDYTTLKNNFSIKLQEIKNKFPTDFYTKVKNNKNYEENGQYYLDYGIYRLETLMKAHPNWQIVGAEVDFTFEYDALHDFGGSIDRLIYDAETNCFLIFDIKSYSEAMDSAKLTTPLQMVVYTQAVILKYGITAEQVRCFYDLPLIDLIQSAGTPGYLDRGLKKIGKSFEKIADNDFKPCPTALCHWCEFCVTNDNATADFKFLCPYRANWTPTDKDMSSLFVWKDETVHKFIHEAYLAMYNRQKK